jgi:hypothetical protein
MPDAPDTLKRVALDTLRTAALSPVLLPRVSAAGGRLGQACFGPHELRVQCFVDDPTVAVRGRAPPKKKLSASVERSCLTRRLRSGMRKCKLLCVQRRLNRSGSSSSWLSVSVTRNKLRWRSSSNSNSRAQRVLVGTQLVAMVMSRVMAVHLRT